jgi:hypothetical protein
MVVQIPDDVDDLFLLEVDRQKIVRRFNRKYLTLEPVLDKTDNLFLYCAIHVIRYRIYSAWLYIPENLFCAGIRSQQDAGSS